MSLAKFEAQQKENERIELEANGLAERARREAAGLADAKKTAAAGEAQAIREVSRALAEAQQNPLLYQFKVLELEKARVERWDGKYPLYFMGTGTSSPSLLLQSAHARCGGGGAPVTGRMYWGWRGTSATNARRPFGLPLSQSNPPSNG